MVNRRRRAADLRWTTLRWTTLAGVLLLGLAAYQGVNVIVILLAPDEVTAAALRAAAPQQPTDPASAFGRAVGAGVVLAAFVGMLTALVHATVGALVIRGKSWARIAAMVLGLISLAGLLPALVMYALFPDATAAQPIFLSLPRSLGTVASMLVIALLAAAYATLLAVLAWRRPIGAASDFPGGR